MNTTPSRPDSYTEAEFHHEFHDETYVCELFLNSRWIYASVA